MNQLDKAQKMDLDQVEASMMDHVEAGTPFPWYTNGNALSLLFLRLRHAEAVIAGIGEPSASTRPRRVNEICARKEHGIDCTQDESAIIKRFFDRHFVSMTTQTHTVADYVATAFPAEYAEWCDEDRSDFV